MNLISKRCPGYDIQLRIDIAYTVYSIHFPSSSTVLPGGLMRSVLVLSLLLPVCTFPVAAQSEAALRDYFEGRSVALKQPMPGTEEGVDIFPGTARPLDYPRYAKRLKEHGTAIRSGESAIITKIKVKSKHIEFQLDGGGYGTMGDETSSDVSTESAPKTRREKNLEAEIKRETDPARKRAMREEIDDLRREREREDARNRSAVAEAEEHRKQNIRQRRLEGGSRFNIRYQDQLPVEALTPPSVMAALADYVDFGALRSEPEIAAPPAPTPRSGLLRKGMMLQDVNAMVGRPLDTRQRKEGTLNVQTVQYSTADGKVMADFVEGVLVRYTITSE
jgi:hypothetical protein